MLFTKIINEQYIFVILIKYEQNIFFISIINEQYFFFISIEICGSWVNIIYPASTSSELSQACFTTNQLFQVLYSKIEADRHFVGWTRVGDSIRYYKNDQIQVRNTNKQGFGDSICYSKSKDLFEDVTN